MNVEAYPISPAVRTRLLAALATALDRAARRAVVTELKDLQPTLSQDKAQRKKSKASAGWVTDTSTQEDLIACVHYFSQDTVQVTGAAQAVVRRMPYNLEDRCYVCCCMLLVSLDRSFECSPLVYAASPFVQCFLLSI